MDNRELRILLFYLILFGACGFAFGHSVGTEQQQKINSQLKTEYDELKENYDALETDYNWRLEACHIQLRDLQDRYGVDYE